LLAALFLPSFSSQAVVIRHDVSKDKYLVGDAHPAFVEMRHQGHGMLISPEWVVTAAHVIFYDYRGKTISIGGKDREIDFVIFHQGFSKPVKGLFTGHSGPSQAYLRANHDIALVKLKRPVENIAPIPLYRSSDEKGEIVTFFGRGNTGDGITGQIEKTRGNLRRAQNTLIAASDQWLTYQFDRGENALPLEGFQGDGDSGGPAIIRKSGVDYLAGLASWGVYDGDISDFKGSLYGMKASLIRISHYAGWIEDVMDWSNSKLEANHHNIHE